MDDRDDHSRSEETSASDEHVGSFAEGEETLPQDDQIGTFADADEDPT